MSRKATNPQPSSELPFAAVRFARATSRLRELIRFYEQGVGLPRLAAFDDHDGYSGVVYGVPDDRRQLEFTQHAAGGEAPAPDPDNLIVLYFATAVAVDDALRRLATLGLSPVPPQNPYWQTRVRGFTLVDPDGWHVVLVAPDEGGGVR